MHGQRRAVPRRHDEVLERGAERGEARERAEQGDVPRDGRAGPHVQVREARAVRGEEDAYKDWCELAI